jgi:hypothetical protein
MAELDAAMALSGSTSSGGHPISWSGPDSRALPQIVRERSAAVRWTRAATALLVLSALVIVVMLWPKAAAVSPAAGEPLAAAGVPAAAAAATLAAPASPATLRYPDPPQIIDAGTLAVSDAGAKSVGSSAQTVPGVPKRTVGARKSAPAPRPKSDLRYGRFE